jgi:hypothetical protein
MRNAVLGAWLGNDAVARDPLMFVAHFGRAAVDLFDGRVDAARARLRKAADELAPGDAFAGWWLAQADG